jgi:glutathione-specific gamma-glutamylcyclotransferase
MPSHAMDLTPELVAKVHRVEPDEGPPANVVLLTDEDYVAIAADLLAGLGNAPLRVFAYGSLIWKPEFEHVKHARATLRGWHRSFCLRIDRWRGTRRQPGLMMALDRGGSCNGIVYTLPPDDRHGQVMKLLRRETSYKPFNNMPILVKVECGGERLPCITFTVRKESPARVPGLPLDEVAQVLARAAGHVGSGAEYLYNTVSHLEQFGITDRNLWTLQKLVAEEIRRM